MTDKSYKTEEEALLDETRVSRQLLMLGERAMKEMANSDVFISGLGGIGVELTKNVTLAGVKSITLHDTKNTTALDLAAQFFLTTEDIGKNRADVSLPKLKELNPFVKMSVSHIDLATQELSFFDTYKCVVLTDVSLAVAERIGEYCHTKNIRFIFTDTKGILGWVFCDFGEDFTVFDNTGEIRKDILIGDITPEGLVTTLTIPDSNPPAKYKHDLQDDDVVLFSELKGMTELNNKPVSIKSVTPHQFKLDKDMTPVKNEKNELAPPSLKDAPTIDVSKFSKYEEGGMASEVKLDQKLKFKSIKESMANPQIMGPEFMVSAFDLHLAMQTYHRFVQECGRAPGVWDKSDCEQFLKLGESIKQETKSNGEVNKELFTKICFTSQGSVGPLAAFFGGFVAQEVLKACSGKYTPLVGWMFLSQPELVPSLESDPQNFQVTGDRTDALRIVVGKDVISKLANMRMFMIGCGAIGCELLKNFAMINVATSSVGYLHCTDNDLIEKSNLNRQFLFRGKDLGNSKSKAAKAATLAMNPNMNIIDHLDKVCDDKESEEKYNDTFFGQLDVIVNALDNVVARRYVDGRAVKAHKPLFDSGTLGPKGHVQVVLPNLTESYSSQNDPKGDEVPVCTLKYFPSEIEHCIEWTRDFSFEGLFVKKPKQWQQLLDEPNLLETLKKPWGGGIDFKVLQNASKLIDTQPQSFEDCVHYARQKFENYFKNKTLNLLFNKPLDHVQEGKKFWVSPKRPPTAIEFDWNDQTHRDFVWHTAWLWAHCWGIAPESDPAVLKKYVESTKLAPFTPTRDAKYDDKKEGKKVVSEEEKEHQFSLMTQKIARFLESAKPFKLTAEDFEKDEDSNHHIDFMTCCSNLRARMYNIKEKDRLSIKGIAGRIIPAIATTTAVVSGLVTVELLKYAAGLRDIDSFRNLFMNLALPDVFLVSPREAPKTSLGKDISFTLWDRWDVKEGRDITPAGLIDYFKKSKGLTVASIVSNTGGLIYDEELGSSRVNVPIHKTLMLDPREAKSVDLCVLFKDPNSNDPKAKDVDGPPVRLFFRKGMDKQPKEKKERVPRNPKKEEE